ncbi:hypothetical protein B7486_00210 [cyanobacterium TDX16]|nr:hypothetical protein B7486_00210 [cyanobacterium TDX16]
MNAGHGDQRHDDEGSQHTAMATVSNAGHDGGEWYGDEMRKECGGKCHGDCCSKVSPEPRGRPRGLIGERAGRSFDHGGDEHNADRHGQDEPADDPGELKGDDAIH